MTKFIMPAGKKLTEEEKVRIETLKDHTKLSNRQIASRISRSEKVIRNFLKNRTEYGRKKASGRPPKLSNPQKRALIRTASNSLKSSGALREELGLNITSRRVRQILNSCGHLENKKLMPKPKLSPQNIEARKQFAISHMSWTKEWRKIIFSDEKKFNLDGPDGWTHYWHDLRTEPKVFSKRQSGGGSVMVWGAIGYRKKVDLIFIDHRMNSADYQEMVGPLFPAWGYEMAGIGWQFQQDNAPIHVSTSSRDYFRERNIPLLNSWPAKSPDLNIIENLWSTLARDVYKEGRQYSNKKDLKESIVKAWKNIEQTRIHGLYDSLQRRMIALYDAKGRHTKY